MLLIALGMVYARQSWLTYGGSKSTWETQPCNLGVSAGAAMFLLFATLVGSILNIPVAELPHPRLG
jgi:uncharacterized membrane protein